jgi:hypothetical protein
MIVGIFLKNNEKLKRWKRKNFFPNFNFSLSFFNPLTNSNYYESL